MPGPSAWPPGRQHRGLVSAVLRRPVAARNRGHWVSRSRLLALGACRCLCRPGCGFCCCCPCWRSTRMRAWRDAPVFSPHRHDALAGPGLRQSAHPRRIHDAGCGLGDGLAGLATAVAAAPRCSGVEWSPLLALATRWRCRRCRACVQTFSAATCGQASWAGHDLVYLFQRPESMARAYRQGRLPKWRPSAWLVSLEFPVPGVVPRWPACKGRMDANPSGFTNPCRHDTALNPDGRLRPINPS